MNEAFTWSATWRVFKKNDLVSKTDPLRKKCDPKYAQKQKQKV